MAATHSIPFGQPQQEQQQEAATTTHRPCNQVAKTFKIYGSIVVEQPRLLLWPAALLCLLVSLGVWALVTIAQQQESQEWSYAQALSDSVAEGLTSLFQQFLQPVAALQGMLRYAETWPSFSSAFPNIASDLIAQVPAGYVLFVTVLPNGNGVPGSTWPPLQLTYGGNSSNLLTDPAYKDGFLATVAASQGTDAIMTELLSVGSSVSVLVTGLLWFDNVTADEGFGLAPPLDLTLCPGCYIPAAPPQPSKKLWGGLSAAISLDQLADLNNSYLKRLQDQGYLLRLERLPSVAVGDATAPTVTLVAQTDPAPSDDAAGTQFDTVLGTFELTIRPSGGWTRAWLAPVIAVEVVFSICASLLLLLLLLSRAQHKLMLRALVPASVISKTQETVDFVRGTLPHVDVETGTPADKILKMLMNLHEGILPPTQDIVLVRSVILQGDNLYEPFNLGERMDAVLMDDDVKRALLNTVGRGGVPVRRSPSKHDSTISLTFSVGDGNSTSLTGLLHGIMTMGPAGGAVPSSLLIDSMPLAPPIAAPPPRPTAAMLRMRLDPLEAAAAAATKPLVSPSPHGSNSSLLRLVSGGFMGGHGGSGSANKLGAVGGASPAPAVLVIGTPDAANDGGCAAASGAPSRMGSGGCTTAAEGGKPAAAVATTRYRRCSADTAQCVVSPAAPLMEEVESFLASATSAGSWRINPFRLDVVAQGHGLSTLAFYLMHEQGLIKRFKLPAQALARYLRSVEDCYNSNPYHNSIHASDVLHTMHMLLCHGGLIPGYVDPLAHLACYVAAIVHDFEHKGLTNDYLINSSDRLAILYNDKSPMENHHLAAAFDMLSAPGCNFLKHLPKADVAAFRKMVIEMVLATDMKSHFQIVSHFSACHLQADNANASAHLKRSGSFTQRKGSSTRRREPHAQAGGSEPGDNRSTATAVLVPVDDAERLLSLQMALKCADLSSLFRDLDVHLTWVGRLEDEFFRQGDREKALGLPVSPLFDRNKLGASRSQVGFYNFVAMPLFQGFTRVFKGAEPVYEFLKENLEYWRARELRDVSGKPAAHSGPGTGAADLKRRQSDEVCEGDADNEL